MVGDVVIDGDADVKLVGIDVLDMIVEIDEIDEGDDVSPGHSVGGAEKQR